MTSTKGRSSSGGALALLAVVWIVVLLVTPLAGSHSLDLVTLFDEGSTASTILWQIRLPRTLLALLAGAVLAASGLAFQTLFRNPMAEPYTLGVAGGAALGAVVAIVLGGDLGQLSIGAASFAGAIGATALVVGLALRRDGVDTPTLLLSGIAVSFSASALILFLQYLADSTKTFRMVRWMMGGVAVVGYSDLLWLAPWTLLLATILVIKRWELNLLVTGEELAASRGVDVGRLRLVLLGATSIAIGATVAVTGPIGFVGLIVPHLVRRLVGHDHLVLVPACLLAGGAFLALADLAARTVMAPAELPVGILTALLGGPFFLWLLLTRR